VLRVANSGPVVPPGELDRLFQPLQRLGDERVRQRREDGRGHEQGHGLGLAIVRAIAAAHGAQLTACARPEGGLDITVRFPLSQAAAQGAMPQGAASRSAQPPGSQP
jgi:signal transduction histidine kinase